MGEAAASNARGGSNDRGSSLVEFAFTMPLLLLMIFSIAEFGRFVAVLSEVEVASEDAVLYAVSGGASNREIPRYTDCDQIRAAALSHLRVLPPDELTIDISYRRMSASAESTTCAAGAELVNSFDAGDRILVTVTTEFRVQIPLVSELLGPLAVSSSTGRRLPLPEA